MRFYVLLALAVLLCIGGASLLIFGFQALQYSDPARAQAQAIAQGLNLTREQLNSYLRSAEEMSRTFMISGAVLGIVGVAIAIIAVVTRPQQKLV